MELKAISMLDMKVGERYLHLVTYNNSLELIEVLNLNKTKEGVINLCKYRKLNLRGETLRKLASDNRNFYEIPVGIDLTTTRLVLSVKQDPLLKYIRDYILDNRQSLVRDNELNVELLISDIFSDLGIDIEVEDIVSTYNHFANDFNGLGIKIIIK